MFTSVGVRKNFKRKEPASIRPQDTDIFNDHTYHTNNSNGDNEEVEYFDDVNYSEIFDNNGNWLKKHIRRLVHVLDTYRISHEAYHEIRMVLKGHLPPMIRLSNEKHLMSEKIPYIKFAEVQNSWIWDCECYMYFYLILTIMHSDFVLPLTGGCHSQIGLQCS